MIGGGAAVIAGGHFQEGAKTAAFAYLFNHWIHAWRGSVAHRALQTHLNRRDEGQWAVEKQRIDLRHIQSNGTFELKSESVQNNPATYATAQGRLAGLNAEYGYQFGDADRIFKGQSSLTLETTSWWGSTESFTYTPDRFGSNTGMIFYTNQTYNGLGDQLSRAIQSQGAISVPIPWYRFALP